MPIFARSSVLSMLKWACDSIRPGIRVAPPPSTTSTSSRVKVDRPRATATIRFPSTSTSPG